MNNVHVLIRMPYIEDEYGLIDIKEKKWTVSKGFMDEKTFDIIGAATKYALEKSDTNVKE